MICLFLPHVCLFFAQRTPDQIAENPRGFTIVERHLNPFLLYLFEYKDIAVFGRSHLFGRRVGLFTQVGKGIFHNHRGRVA